MNSPEHKLVHAWRSEVQQHIVGDPAPVTELMLTLLAGGHALLESAPGLGKTTLVRTVAIAAGLDLGRSAMHQTSCPWMSPAAMWFCPSSPTHLGLWSFGRVLFFIKWSWRTS